MGYRANDPAAVKLKTDAETGQRNLAAQAERGGTRDRSAVPEAMEALKNRPEFQDLKPEDIVKGKEILEKQEAAKKEAEKARLRGEAKEMEKKARLLPVEDTSLKSEYTRVSASWTSKPFPDF